MKPKLLVVELWGVGDLAIATPFLRAACEKYDVTVLAKPYAHDLQKRFWPGVRVISFVAPWTAFKHKYRLFAWPWLEILRLGRTLVRERFDVGLSARWDPRDHLLLVLARVRRRIGFSRAWSRIFLNQPAERPAPKAHRYEYWHALANALDLEVPQRQNIPMPPARQGYLLVHTGAAQPVRVWPLERFRNLTLRLRERGFAVQVACDVNQREWWLAVGETNIATPETVTELLNLTDAAGAFIGNDSGPGHLAAFNGVPTFTVFGPQLPEWFAPLHPASEWCEGRPCVHKPCSDYCQFPVPHCLWDLSEQSVRPRIDEFVARHRGSLQRESAPIEHIRWVEPETPQPVPAGEPLRVLHVHNSADIYGASRSLVRLIKTIDRRRFKPLVVVPEEGLLKAMIEAQGVEVLVHPRLSIVTRQVFGSWRIVPFLLNYPLSVLYLWRLIRRRGIDLVHTNTGVVLSPALAARLAGVPHMWHVRDWFQEFRNVWPAFSWYVRTLSQKVIAVSHAVAGQFEPRDNVVVIHNGFSLEEFQVPRERLRGEFRARYGLDGEFVVGCVGRIKLVRKGQEVLVRATALLKKRGLDIKALIVGAPFPGNESHLTQLQELVGELGIADRVVFTGELADARAAYAAMDVYAMTSAQPEPFGGVVMEAMSMGLPVIATNIGGSLDQVVGGVTGEFVPPDDATSLADGIERMMRKPELRQQMGSAARERIASQFSLPEMVHKIEHLFEESAAVRKN
ncbi:MAG: glycosyltransferase [Verrucomicrobia bacterium]|nr:glycosyltransferase [Verrucomicrobiota bacterium]